MIDIPTDPALVLDLLVRYSMLGLAIAVAVRLTK